MSAAKEEIIGRVEQLPDDIQYPIYVREKIDDGHEDLEAGRTLSQRSSTSGWPSGSV
jgi:hypothetical protein